MSNRTEQISRIRRYIAFFIPPENWRLPVILILGILTGLTFLILRLSNALSYLSDDPRTCVNCHVMAPEYATWQHSSHTRVTTCVDCHVPHDNLLHKYTFKGSDGMRHAYVFTFRLEPQVIQIRAAGRQARNDI